MGIAFDEGHRMKDSMVDYVTNLYPLVDRRLTRRKCIEIILQEGLPVPVKSGCFYCPFNSIDRWRWLLEAHPNLFDSAIDLEENSKHYPRQRLTDQVYRHRDTVTLRELKAKLKLGEYGDITEVEASCGGECMT